MEIQQFSLGEKKKTGENRKRKRLKLKHTFNPNFYTSQKELVNVILLICLDI